LVTIVGPGLAGGLKVWVVRAMKAQIFEPQMDNLRRCPKCAAPTRLTHTILDSRRGSTVRLFRCAACGDRLWDDNLQPAIARKDFEVPHLHELAAKTARKAHE
jgi:hypothetical protein